MLHRKPAPREHILGRAEHHRKTHSDATANTLHQPPFEAQEAH